MKNETNLTTLKTIEAFKQAWMGGMELILKACKIYADAIDTDETSKYDFHAALPKMSAACWSRIEKVGRGQMHYLLLCDSTVAGEKLEKLPFSEQKKAIDVGFEVLTEKGDVLKVKSENLTPEMCKQVIAKDHIRDIGAQRAYMESQKIIVKMETEKPSDLYSVKGKVLHVYAPTQFTRHQLVNLLQDMG